MDSSISPRLTLDRQMQELQDDILLLGSMVEKAVLDSVQALKKRDVNAARAVYKGDQLINEKRFEIENNCVAIIATQQPMARDLRFLTSVLEINTELERMGDYAKGIARIGIMMGGEPPLKPLIDIPRMAEIATDMLHRALQAFIEGDTERAYEIPKDDDQVDDLYNQVNRELVTFMISDPSTIDRANYLMWTAHNLERMADRVTNICERTIYIDTGVLNELDVSDDEHNEIIE
ncbi:MAG: phosphate signaling complex protein PhoU [Anaerolineales bacterium]|nr:phosphate signaling complex protein PhoU [Anaerolineales bacterium]